MADTLREVRHLKENQKYKTIILVSGQDFPDGLSASYLATANNNYAPILTTDAKPSHYQLINKYVLENLRAGGTVYIIGGQNAIPDEAVADLADLNCVRLAGNTRYLTNLAVLDEVGIPDGSEVLIATGTSFPDSLSVSSTGLPLFLVNGDKGTLTAKQEAYLSELGARGCTFTIIGGNNAISEEMQTLIEGCTGVTADRIAGSTRYKTSVAIAERYFPEVYQAVIAYGLNFPDALCAGPLAVALGAPAILAASEKTSSINGAKEYVNAHKFNRGYVLGGPTLISDEDVRTVLGLPASTEILVK